MNSYQIKADWCHQQLDLLVKKLNDGSYRGGDIVVLKASYQKQ